eukprot:6186473-Pleurochrysis_carterae.AAC.1
MARRAVVRQRLLRPLLRICLVDILAAMYVRALAHLQLCSNGLVSDQLGTNIALASLCTSKCLMACPYCL